MDLAKIKSLIKMLEGSDLTEIEITEGDGKVRIARHANHTVVATAQTPAPIVYQTPTPAPAPIAAAPAAEAAPTKEHKAEETIKGHAMKSPMVGTVYLSSSPDAEPFVRVGQRVEAGDIVCIVEAMKMFNQIEADVSGTISGRLIENGQPVEYGQTLFIIE
ncbi:MAG: acetyl-CoA carboxylase biotin carboxyl carrier protein [Gammaproteobacteria bacterium]